MGLCLCAIVTLSRDGCVRLVALTQEVRGLCLGVIFLTVYGPFKAAGLCASRSVNFFVYIYIKLMRSVFGRSKTVYTVICLY